MQVILKKDVQNLGEAGELVNVKDGYARNFLIPKNCAEIATEGALKNREQNLARIQAKQEKLHQEALAKAAEIEKLGQIELSAKAGESGKLFGTITTKKLCEELKEKASVFGLEGSCYPTVKGALQKAKEESNKNDFIFVGGSCFIVADLLASLKRQETV